MKKSGISVKKKRLSGVIDLQILTGNDILRETERRTEIMEKIFKILAFRNQIHLNESETEATIRPVLEIELERAATLFISQSIDGMEMFEPVRYELKNGPQSIFLKTMRVIHPRRGKYKVSITVSTSAVHAEIDFAAQEIDLFAK